MSRYIFVWAIALTIGALSPADAQRREKSPYTRSGEVNVCSAGLSDSEWAYRYNKYVGSFERNAISVKEIAYMDPFHECKNPSQKNRLITTETALSPDAFVRVEGDVCAPEPTLILATFFPTPRVSVEKIEQLGSKNQVVTTMSSLPAALYLGREARGNAFYELNRKLEIARSVIQMQCGELPERIRLSGRSDFPQALRFEGVGYSRKKVRNQYGFKEFYSGTFFPRQDGYQVEHANPEEKVLYDVLTGKYNAVVAKSYKYNPDRAAVGLAAVAAAALGAYSTTNLGTLFCDDQTIPLDERAALGC